MCVFFLFLHYEECAENIILNIDIRIDAQPHTLRQCRLSFRRP